jgi:regulator of sigma E protease
METFLNVINVIVYNILIPVLLLSFLIFVHELGHYIAARMFKVAIKEFAIGMGPKILYFTKNKIIYSIRAIPMGGSLTMHGEDEDTVVENAVNRKPVWQRFIIMFSGSFMNILLGFMIMAIIVSGMPDFPTTKINRFAAGANSNAPGKLVEGDEILRVNGRRINVFHDFVFTLIREGKDPMTVTVMRNGEKVVIEDVRFWTVTEGSTTVGERDFAVESQEKTFFGGVRQTFFQSFATVRMLWLSVFDLITGRFNVDELSGPVGVTQIIGGAAQDVVEGRGSGGGFLFLLAIITMNLGVFNLLPVPALDGGRIAFIIIEIVRRKPIKPEHEGYIHLAGFAALILFLIFITYRDIVKLVVG